MPRGAYKKFSDYGRPEPEYAIPPAQYVPAGNPLQNVSRAIRQTTNSAMMRGFRTPIEYQQSHFEPNYPPQQQYAYSPSGAAMHPQVGQSQFQMPQLSCADHMNHINQCAACHSRYKRDMTTYTYTIIGLVLVVMYLITRLSDKSTR